MDSIASRPGRPERQRAGEATARNVFMFSGQGSQYFQMGRLLYEEGGTFARWMRRMDTVVRDLGGPAVLDLVYGDRSKAAPFDDLRASHPAIFMVEYALAQCLLEQGIEPDLTLGVSLGTVAAAVTAGCLEMEEALGWVVRQAAFVAEHGVPGGMIGVLSAPALHLLPALQQRSVIAAFNGPAHWVLAARAGDLPSIEADLKAHGVSFASLPVRYPFHSPWLFQDAACAATELPAPQARAARLPLLCCAAAGQVQTLSPDQLWRAALAPIHFDRTVAATEAGWTDCRYIDVGPSGTLAALLKPLLPAGSASRVHRVLSPYGGERTALDALLSAAAPSAPRAAS